MTALSLSLQRVLCGTRVVGRLSGFRKPVLQALHQPSTHRLLVTVLPRSYSTVMAYCIEERGAPNSLDYRVYFKSADGQYVSPFHDIPLYNNSDENILNMVVEVPRWTNAKMEIATKERLNPIKQDTKKGKLRFVHNCFPHHGYIWNYGALPQTWENPSHKDDNTGCLGDNDPIDVCEIGYKVHKRGAVIQVKPLGVMALIDEGETDWKILAIDVTDPLAKDLNDIQDIRTHMPGFLEATREWFKIYKIPAGKPVNQFAFEGQAKNKDFAVEVIKQTNAQWKQLMKKEVENVGELACENTSVDDSPYKISADDASATVQAAPPFTQADTIESEVDKWHYVKL